MNPPATILQRGAEWIDPGFRPLLTGVVFLAGVGTLVLCLVGVRAYLRRRTVRYLLVTVALTALLLRTVVGVGTMLGVVPMTLHHLISHALDFFVAAVILYAVYRSSPDIEMVPLD